MNKAKTLLLVCCFAAITFSCSREAEQNVAPPEGMIAMDLGAYGKPFSLFLPDTARARCVITEDPSGTLWIESGKSFAVSISEQHEDLEFLKKDLREDEVNKLQAFVVDTTNALVWESRITDPEYHFVVNAAAGKGEYSFTDLRDSEARPFSREAVMSMYESCRNIVPKDRK